MPPPPAPLIDYLRRLARPGGSSPESDGTLLARFTAERDEAAFAALMGRHGPMVLGVCRGVVSDAHAAEDCAQATFLVLARKAAALRGPVALPSWLHGVALRVARKAQSQAHQARVQPLTAAPEPADPRPGPPDSLAARELVSLLDEEVARLPEVYRLPMLLCCREDRTQREAAELLGWTEASVRGRLERGRKRLHGRLTRRGLTLAAVLWAEEVARAFAAGPRLGSSVTAAAGAAVLAAARGGVSTLVSARAVALSQGVLKTMILTKGKIAAALVLAATMLGGGAGWLACRVPAAEAGGLVARQSETPAPAAKDKPEKDNTADDKDAIQGTWLVTGLEAGGKEVEDNAETKTMKSGKWTIAADKITIAVPNQSEEIARYKLDATKKPKELDAVTSGGPNNQKGKTIRTIYSLEGDVLKIYLPRGLDQDKRPTELATKEGDKGVLLTLMREKPAKKKPAAAGPAESPAVRQEKVPDRAEKMGMAVASKGGRTQIRVTVGETTYAAEADELEYDEERGSLLLKGNVILKTQRGKEPATLMKGEAVIVYPKSGKLGVDGRGE